MFLCVLEVLPEPLETQLFEHAVVQPSDNPNNNPPLAHPGSSGNHPDSPNSHNNPNSPSSLSLHPSQSGFNKSTDPNSPHQPPPRLVRIDSPFRVNSSSTRTSVMYRYTPFGGPERGVRDRKVSGGSGGSGGLRRRGYGRAHVMTELDLAVAKEEELLHLKEEIVLLRATIRSLHHEGYQAYSPSIPPIPMPPGHHSCNTPQPAGSENIHMEDSRLSQGRGDHLEVSSRNRAESLKVLEHQLNGNIDVMLPLPDDEDERKESQL